jgi:hypothetical protein
MTNDDIKLVATNDLISELQERYDHMVLGLHRPDKTGDLGSYKLRWKGDSFMAAGLCSAIQEDINTHRRDNEKPIPPEEES